MRIAVDLTWVKPKASGGIESYIRNLLEGFELYSTDEFVLLLAENNAESFSSNQYEKIILPVDSNNVKSRIVYQNTRFCHELNKTNADLFFCPVYAMPLLYTSKIPCVATVHDLQAVHFPNYFSKWRVKWLDFNWKTISKRTRKIITTSEFTKNDLVTRYNVKPNQITVLSIPVILHEDFADFAKLKKKYAITEYEYYYTVVSMLPHKNLITVINMIKKIIVDNILEIPRKLIVSGVNGISKKKVEDKIREYGLENYVILTGYVDDSERNSLMKNCYSFVFPSIFEGFGMPPIEAMMMGTPVITTRKASLYEVTEGKCSYVDNPFDESEWITSNKSITLLTRNKINFEEYSLKNVTIKYMKCFSELISRK